MARPTKEQEQAIRERRKQATALRLAGVDWQSIADRLGYTDRDHACQDVRRALKQSAAELSSSLEDLRQEELARIDRLIAAIWAQAMAGDQRAAETCARLIDRRVRLLGLDAPIKHEVITIDAIDRQLQELAERYPELRAAGDRGEVSEAAGPEGVSGS